VSLHEWLLRAPSSAHVSAADRIRATMERLTREHDYLPPAIRERAERNEETFCLVRLRIQAVDMAWEPLKLFIRAAAVLGRDVYCYQGAISMRWIVWIDQVSMADDGRLQLDRWLEASAWDRVGLVRQTLREWLEARPAAGERLAVDDWVALTPALIPDGSRLLSSPAPETSPTPL
jgi:hypothetical protein